MITLTSNQSNKRIDAYLAEALGYSRTSLLCSFDVGNITVNGRPVSKSYKLTKGDIIRFIEPDPKVIFEDSEVEAEEIPLNIIYEDNSIIVINKPQGMVVHPAAGSRSGTMVNALLYHSGKLSDINGKFRPGIVHRIDKDTSGLIVAAKTSGAHRSLAAQFADHSAGRIYEAVVHGNMRNDSGTVNAPIGRNPSNRKTMAVVPTGRSAVTHYKVLERLNGFTHIQCRLETGRTHQIRVHMAYIGHPVAGDRAYAGSRRNFGLTGQCLHACGIHFKHPDTGAQVCFNSDLPDYFIDLLAKLRC